MLEGKAAALPAKGDDRRHRQRRDEERADDSERRRGEDDPVQRSAGRLAAANLGPLAAAVNDYFRTTRS
jgi:hypothetical protein